MFSQVCVCLHGGGATPATDPMCLPSRWSQVASGWEGGGTPVSGLRSIPNLWSHVLSRGYFSLWSQVYSQTLVPCPFWGLLQSQGPLAGTGVPPQREQAINRICCSRYASSVFMPEDFLVILWSLSILTRTSIFKYYFPVKFTLWQFLKTAFCFCQIWQSC